MRTIDLLASAFVNVVGATAHAGGWLLNTPNIPMKLNCAGVGDNWANLELVISVPAGVKCPLQIGIAGRREFGTTQARCNLTVDLAGTASVSIPTLFLRGFAELTISACSLVLIEVCALNVLPVSKFTAVDRAVAIECVTKAALSVNKPAAPYLADIIVPSGCVGSSAILVAGCPTEVNSAQYLALNSSFNSYTVDFAGWVYTVRGAVLLGLPIVDSALIDLYLDNRKFSLQQTLSIAILAQSPLQGICAWGAAPKGVA